MDFEEELRTSPEERDYMAARLAEDFEREQGSTIDRLIAEGTLERETIVELLTEALKRMEIYLITS